MQFSHYQRWILSCRLKLFFSPVFPIHNLLFFTEGGGKVVSLEELEARMRGGPPMVQTEAPKFSRTEEDLSAFKKLVFYFEFLNYFLNHSLLKFTVQNAYLYFICN